MTAVEEASRRAGDEVQTLFKKHRDRSEAYEALCTRAGLLPADVALAWLLANPVVAAPIIGPRTVGQLENAIPALDVMLPADFVRELEDIWPGPGGEAPEAYAW
jgi:aryl-alcohol dehydrogenase-like predicted oxidoreductase